MPAFLKFWLTFRLMFAMLIVVFVILPIAAFAQTAADAAPGWFPFDAMWWGVVVVVARQIFEIGFKLIPDDTTNPLLQGLRVILRFASGYFVNKTTSIKK